MLVFGAELGVAQSAAVVMAGGHGTRFWPLSTRKFPKQFLPLLPNGKSLIQATVDRLAKINPRPALLVVTGQDLVNPVQEQVPSAQILVEPRACNTAPCVGLAALYVLKQLGDVPMLCLPADHVIEPEAEIVKVLSAALEMAAAEDVLITIGIKPTFPETGYGYIHRGEKYKSSNLPEATSYKVQRFVEKPNLQTAREYLSSGEFFWNSGMFAFRPSVILAAMEKHAPDLFNALQLVRQALTDNNEQAVCAAFERIEPVSIDVAVMEKAENVLMLPGDSFVWSDLGSWAAWAAFRGSHIGAMEDNVAHGDTFFINSRGCAGFSQKRIIAGVGLENVMVVETDEAILVCHKDAAQDVKKIVDYLKSQGREDIL